MTGLGLPTGGGDFVPFVKYNAKAGRWFAKTDDGEVEVEKLTAVADFDNIKTGEITFAPGSAPIYDFDSGVGAGDAVSTEQSRRGFVMNLFSEKKLGGVRELASCSGIMNDVMNELYADYDSGKDDHAGELPVIQVTGIEPVESKHGTNYRPLIKIAKWTKRPAAFDEVPERKATNGNGAAVPPPVDSRPAQPVEEDDDDIEF